MTKHIFIVAGDASGDVYGAQLIEAIKKEHPDWIFSGLGGDRMACTGMNFLYPLVKEFSVMGFLPVILGMPKVMRFLEIILDFFDRNRPDIVVLIDYPGFNMYLATHTKRRNIPTVYYVTPQIWAWAPWRIRKIKKLMTKMLVIFPFEVDFYQKAHVPVEYVGHPLLDRMSTFTPDALFEKNLLPGIQENMLALLPGSRKIEITGNLPTMLWAAHKLHQKFSVSHIFLALASEKYRPLIEEILQKYKKIFSLPEVTVVSGKTYDIIYHSRMVFVTSGTATLETAILKKPMVVFYRVPKLHKWILENTSFLKCKYIALPNIVSAKKIVPEFVFSASYPENILNPIYSFWQNTPERTQCLEDLEKMQKQMEKPGASQNAAKAIIDLIQSRHE